VSKPLVQHFDRQLGFLGQFSAVSQVELRVQVGGTLTGAFFKDGDIVRKGNLLFTIDPRPYEITLAEATAQLNVASAHLELADRQLDQAKDLEQRLTDVLDAARQLLVARDDVESTRADAARAAVHTFRALGGGWDVHSNASIASVK
jgi:multidrug resistance efflux pump